MFATPATWLMILEAGWETPLSIVALTGGEALPGDLADKLLLKSKELWNMYGPTETTILSTQKQTRVTIATAASALLCGAFAAFVASVAFAGCPSSATLGCGFREAL